MLKPYAITAANSRGRLYPQPGGEQRGPRDPFQRDRDRIIHSVPFRRLRHKTQVFMAPDGDHFRVRLTHSIEVAQIGRTIARALGLNEDLTEALCLAHDLGHPPFGHAGERALQDALVDHGGFDHNGHALRLLTEIETPYPEWRGLNLTWETLEGLAKHNGPIADPEWALAGVDARWSLDLNQRSSLEAQVAAIADDIAYDNHDIDDGLRSGLLTGEQLLSVPSIARQRERLAQRYPNLDARRVWPELIRDQIGAMVNDVITETERRIDLVGIETLEDVRNHPYALVGFSDQMAREEATLKRFMYANLYHHPSQLEMADHANRIVTGLFAAYHAAPELMAEGWASALPNDEPQRSRHIGDFVAGMTDRYAVTAYRKHIGQIELPNAF